MSQKKIKPPTPISGKAAPPDVLKDLAPDQVQNIKEYSILIRRLCLTLATAIHGKQVREPGKLQPVPVTWEEHGAPILQDIVNECTSMLATKGRGKLGVRELIMILATVAGQQMGLTLGHMHKQGKPLPEGYEKDIKTSPLLFEAAFLTATDSGISMVLDAEPRVI